MPAKRRCAARRLLADVSTETRFGRTAGARLLRELSRLRGGWRTVANTLQERRHNSISRRSLAFQQQLILVAACLLHTARNTGSFMTKKLAGVTGFNWFNRPVRRGGGARGGGSPPPQLEIFSKYRGFFTFSGSFAPPLRSSSEMSLEAFSCIHPKKFSVRFARGNFHHFSGLHRKTAPKTGVQSKCKHETENINKGGPLGKTTRKGPTPRVRAEDLFFFFFFFFFSPHFGRPKKKFWPPPPAEGLRTGLVYSYLALPARTWAERSPTHPCAHRVWSRDTPPAGEAHLCTVAATPSLAPVPPASTWTPPRDTPAACWLVTSLGRRTRRKFEGGGARLEADIEVQCDMVKLWVDTCTLKLLCSPSAHAGEPSRSPHRSRSTVKRCR